MGDLPLPANSEKALEMPGCSSESLRFEQLFGYTVAKSSTFLPRGALGLEFHLFKNYHSSWNIES